MYTGVHRKLCKPLDRPVQRQSSSSQRTSARYRTLGPLLTALMCTIRAIPSADQQTGQRSRFDLFPPCLPGFSPTRLPFLHVREHILSVAGVRHGAVCSMQQRTISLCSSRVLIMIALLGCLVALHWYSGPMEAALLKVKGIGFHVICMFCMFLLLSQSLVDMRVCLSTH